MTIEEMTTLLIQTLRAQIAKLDDGAPIRASLTATMETCRLMLAELDARAKK